MSEPLNELVDGLTESLHHRLALLDFLRKRAHNLHLSASLHLFGAPDDVVLSRERQDPRECLEERKLVQALVHWTTPYAESPITWRPMREAPRDGTEIVVRLFDDDDPDEPDRAWWSRTEYCWHLSGGSAAFADDAFTEWRELRDDEATPFTAPEQALCGHGIDHNADHCLDCEAAQDREDAL